MHRARSTKRTRDGTTFVPSMLFAQGVGGFWLDPSDMSTMYQDSAGTIPVTAVEQPVGLMLDKSRGLMLGPELVSNTTFDSSNNWVLQSGWVVSNGILTATNVPAYQSGTTTPLLTTLVSGKLYKCTFTITSFTSGGIRVQFSGGTTVNSTAISASGTHTIYIKAEAAHINVGVQPVVNGTTLSIDNFSLKELYGNHATQSVTASRPVLSARKNVLLATETLATQSVTSIAAQYTLSFTGTGSVTLSGTATGTLTGTGVNDRVSLTVTPTAGTLTLTVSGSVTKAQLELGTSAGPYQRVNTATDYDTDPRYFPKYLQFSSAVAIDDFLNLPYMSLYNGGAASIVCARDAVSQATDTYVISERSTTDADPKYFPSRQLASAGNMDAYISDDAGSVILDTVGSPFSGVANAVIRSIVDSGNNLKLFKNGVLAANDNYTRSGTLTLNNTTIGASVSTTTSNYASMKLYGLIVTKSALTDAQRIACERHLSRKAGIAL